MAEKLTKKVCGLTAFWWHTGVAVLASNSPLDRRLPGEMCEGVEDTLQRRVATAEQLSTQERGLPEQPAPPPPLALVPVSPVCMPDLVLPNSTGPVRLLHTSSFQLVPPGCCRESLAQ
ncbi:uncharacterized protein LOC144169549 [Haemaphysalis longicornis]